MNKNSLKSKPIDNTNNINNDKSGFLLGSISAVLLIVCVIVLVLFNNKQVQRIITEKINIDAVNKSSDIEFSTINSKNSSEAEKTSTLLTEKILNVRVQHPNDTVGRLTNISFTQKNTIVEIAVTNGSQYTIFLNLHGKGVVLVDDLGNKHNLKPPSNNPYLEIKSGNTFKGELVFQGGVTSKANHITLITNNQIGSDQPLSRRPKMMFEIPLQ
ncbi:MAG: hypothetical protein AAF915_22530 [Cyanobacteria bacterium P01_D01_bin.50]